VASILAEPESPGYWFAASRDGNRESHYRGAHLGATLAHPLLPQEWVKACAWDPRNIPGELEGRAVAPRLPQCAVPLARCSSSPTRHF
jgi:hypothetical protein